MEKVKINGIECLLFEGAEKPRKNSEYPHEYYIRHADGDFDLPVTVENYVLVNKFGFIQAKEAFVMQDAKNPYIEIASFINENGEELIPEGDISENCTFCDKTLEIKNDCYAITSGYIDRNAEGFLHDDESYLAIICPNCHEKITDLLQKIKDIAVTKKKTFIDIIDNMDISKVLL